VRDRGSGPARAQEKRARRDTKERKIIPVTQRRGYYQLFTTPCKVFF
jgi:hypothetical protein